MISVGEAKNIIQQKVKRSARKRVALAEGAGLVLAEDIFAQTDIPNFIQSSVDGYAIKFEDRNAVLTVVTEMAAGADKESSIDNGQAARIFTGAPLPNGSDTVVMQEKTTVKNNLLHIEADGLNIGENVRPKGGEIKANDLAMSAGSLLTPAALGFIAGLGISEICVYPEPVVSIIITGKELQQPGMPLTFGQVYDANTVILKSALGQAGIKEIKFSYADDELIIVQTKLEEALQQSDVVLLVGGISVGDYDFVLQATQLCGVQQHFHKIKQKPGKPLFFGTKEEKIVFGLPGNPSSALTSFYEYVLSALQLMMGKSREPEILDAKLTHAYTKKNGLTHFLKGRYSNGFATPLHAQESYKLGSFAHANCLIILEETKENFAIGDNVSIHLIPNF